MYQEKYIFQENLGNNALSYHEREKYYKKFSKKPTLIIPKRILGDIDDVKISENLVFEEFENGKIFSCFGLENFVEIQRKNYPTIVIFDNHNHALFFWCEAIKKGIIKPGFDLFHMDQHSDLWENPNEIEDFYNLEKMWNFTNFSCNVGNYIVPAKRAGIVGRMIRLENEFQIDENMATIPSTNSVLNLDLDIFNLDYIDPKKIQKCIVHFLMRTQFVTICTSPYFIDQNEAISRLREIFEIDNTKKI